MTHKVFFNNDYVACNYSFDTTRKSEEIAKSLKNVSSVSIEDPSAFTKTTENVIQQIHSPEYVHAVKTGKPLHLAESQGFQWDPDIYTMAVAHNSGVVAGVDLVLHSTERFVGTLSSGLHHASREAGEGFCTFNGLSTASQHALNCGAERVLILDFDDHCGGGTRSTTDATKVIQVDVSTNYYDSYSPVNEFDYFSCSKVGAYLKEITLALQHASTLGGFDLVIYNAGMDPANSGVDYPTLLAREAFVCEWALTQNAPLVYTMAGGYLGAELDMDGLVSLHRLTIDTFASA
jgi:acetoin utilization deacetylase AcuC-like enzyme